ncbi:hypothetical protein OAH09_02065, partial [bacterium]|nr:hypothetical protein [bacterium]
MNTNLSKADSLFRKENSSKMTRVNSRAFLFPLIVGFLMCFLHSPALAQQEGAPELSAEASRSIDKGLNYLLTIQR